MTRSRNDRGSSSTGSRFDRQSAAQTSELVALIFAGYWQGHSQDDTYEYSFSGYRFWGRLRGYSVHPNAGCHPHVRLWKGLCASGNDQDTAGHRRLNQSHEPPLCECTGRMQPCASQWCRATYAGSRGCVSTLRQVLEFFQRLLGQMFHDLLHVARETRSGPQAR